MIFKFLFGAALFSQFFVQNLRAEQHGAHSHDAAEFNMAVTGNILVLDVEIPAMTIYGFEHVAATDKDKKARDEGVKKLSQILNLVKIDNSNCRAETVKLDAFVPEEDDDHDHDDAPTAAKSTTKKPLEKPLGKTFKKAQHGDVKGQFKITCEKPLAGKKVTFAASKTFPGIKRIEIQLLSGDKQSGEVIKNDVGSLSL